ncbi:hypothetical protein D3C77_663590 [compost metagenome]
MDGIGELQSESVYKAVLELPNFFAVKEQEEGGQSTPLEPITPITSTTEPEPSNEEPVKYSKEEIENIYRNMENMKAELTRLGVEFDKDDKRAELISKLEANGVVASAE